MRNKHSRTDFVIDLTSLLDVIFIVLLIVMCGQKLLSDDTKEAAAKAEEMMEAADESLRESGDSQLIGIYMRKLIELCEQNGIRVVVLQAPMNKASFDTLQEGFVKGYALYMQSLSDLYPDITVEREIPCYENALFGDSSHLNETGALQYTEEIAQKYMN